MKRICAVGLTMIILLLCAAPCFALESDAVRVAVIDYPNFLNMEEDGSVYGYAYEYLMEIQKYTGWNYEFVEMSFSDASDALQTGEIDLMAGSQYTEARADLWLYSEDSMGEGGTILCTMPGNEDYAYNDFSAYEGIRIAALTGSVRIEQTEQKLAEYGVTAEFVEYDTDAESKEALAADEVDAILMSNIRSEAAYKVIARINRTPLYFCISKDRPELKTELDAAVEYIHLEQPYYEMQLDQKYYGDIRIQTSLSEAELKYVESAGEITVAISTDMAPVEYYDESTGTYCGLIPDTLALISENTGLSFAFVPREDVATLNAQLRSDAVQMIASVVCLSGFTNSLEISTSDSFYDNGMAFVTRDDNKANAAMSGKMILKTGYPLFDWVAQRNGYTNIIYADSFHACLDAVAKGEADYTLIPSNSAGIFLDHADYSKLNSLFLAGTSYRFGFGISNYADPLLASILNKSLSAITDEQHTQLLVDNISRASNRNATIQDYVRSHRRELLVLAVALMLLVVSLVIWNVRKLNRLNRQLRAEAARADSSSRAKSEFLSNMSHDIRTPMTAILNLTDLSLEELEQPELLKDDLSKIKMSGHYLLGLLNDVLDMSRIESGKMTLSPSVYTHAEFVNYMDSMTAPLCKQRGIHFDWDKGTTGYDVYVDITRFNQIFYNLLSNAIKYTPEGGSVSLLVKNNRVKDGVLTCDFVIQDTGIGMSEEFQKKLFIPFERAENVNAYAGTGLGLSITRQIVDLMHGAIHIESALGKGTTVTLMLPMPIATEAQRRAWRDNRDAARESASAHKTEKRLMRILLAEDHQLNQEIITRLLQKKNYEVQCTSDGAEALAAFLESTVGFYTAIIMDIRMPVMDGLAATQAIRALDRSDAKTIPIIAMSANAYDEDVKKSLDAGMDAHLSKPIEPDKLYETLAMLIESKKT